MNSDGRPRRRSGSGSFEAKIGKSKMLLQNEEGRKLTSGSSDSSKVGNGFNENIAYLGMNNKSGKSFRGDAF